MSRDPDQAGTPPEDGDRLFDAPAPRPGGAGRSGRRWPRALRRGPMELVATILIALGVFMLMQPFAIGLFTWSFLVTLTGTVMFIAVSHFPE